MRDVKSELLHVRELLRVLVRRERCAEAKTEFAARRLDRVEKEKDEVDDAEVGLRQVVCRQGFRLWQSLNMGNRLHPCQRRARPREVLTIGTDAWAQVESDHAEQEELGNRMSGDKEQDKEKANRVALTADLAAQSEKKGLRGVRSPTGPS